MLPYRVLQGMRWVYNDTITLVRSSGAIVARSTGLYSDVFEDGIGDQKSNVQNIVIR